MSGAGDARVDGPVGPLRGRASALLIVPGLALLAGFLQMSWSLPPLERHGFRQSQTALSAWRMAEGGPLLRYETPLFGAPWTVPFELPLHQGLAAGVSQLGVPLNAAGRAVSVAMLLLLLWPLRRLLVELQPLDGAHTFRVVAALVLVCPALAYWSRAFLIETTALACGVAYVAASTSGARSGRARDVALALGCGVLAALVKVTTFVALAPAAVVAFVVVARRQPSWRRQALQHLGVAVVIGAATVAWTTFADAQKEQNPFTATMTSAALGAWNFGSLEQRLSLSTWTGVIGGRGLADSLGHPLCALVVVGGAAVAGRRTLLVLGACVAAYLLPFLVFTNLHLIHDYYQVANAGFLTVGAGVVVVALERGGKRTLARVVFGVVMVACLHRLVTHFGPTLLLSQEQRASVAVAEATAAHTAVDDVVLVLGWDWSAELPYLAKRRTVMVPDWADPSWLASLGQEPAALLGGHRLGAVLVCPTPLSADARVAQALQPILTSMTRRAAAECTLWHVGAGDDEPVRGP